MADGPNDDEDGGDNERDGGAGANETTDGTVNGAKPKTKITYDKYVSVVNLLVRRVNQSEMGTAEDTPEGVEGEKLAEWYLEQKEDELNGEEDYHSEKALVKKIIRRMAKVCFLRRLTIFISNLRYRKMS
jgi:DNA replication licensing factor MCM6